MSAILAKLRGERDEKSKEVNRLLNLTPADKRMPKEDAAKVDELLGNITNIDEEIDRHGRALRVMAHSATEAGERVEEIDAAMREAGAAPGMTINDVAVLLAAIANNTKDPSKQSQTSKELRAFLGGGLGALDEDARRRLQARQTPDIRNAMSTTTTTEGGFTVATEYYKQLAVAMKGFGGVRNVATILRTASGADMNFPTSDPTAEVGEIVGQNAAVAALDTVFANVALSVYKYSSKKIALPFELIQDSFIDIEGYINEVLAMRLGRITAQHYTTGTGTAQPRGLVTAAAAGKVGIAGQTLTVIYDDLVDLEHSVNYMYRGRPGVGYMMADSSLKVIRKIKDSQNRPIFVPGYEANAMINGGAPDTLMGRPIYINDDMAAMAANAKSILFGDFKKYFVRDVMDLTLFRMTDSAFTLNGQVGFVGFMRTGGNLIDPGLAVKYYQNSAT